MCKNMTDAKRLDSKVVISVEGVSKYFAPTKGSGTMKQAFTALFKKDKGAYKREGYWALKDINFEVRKGEFFGIVGRNGCGKSTLLKMIAGIYESTKGEIKTDGKIVPFIELGVGFNPELTGKDNVFLNGALLGFSRKDMFEMYDEIVAFAELEEHMDVKLKNFSSGMQVRLAFSIAIRAKSDILLIDEVLAVGDANFQQKCYDYFEELKKRDSTVVFVSHDMSAVRRFCNRAIYINSGELVSMGSPSDISDIYTEQNIANDVTTDEVSDPADSLTTAQYKVSAKIALRTKDSTTLQVLYDYETTEEMYVGISVQKDGVSIAEITTSLKNTLLGTGMVEYALNTNIFNAGMYRIGVGLFTLDNRKLVAVAKGKCQFVIKGSDITKGAAVKLPDTWAYKGL